MARKSDWYKKHEMDDDTIPLVQNLKSTNIHVFSDGSVESSLDLTEPTARRSYQSTSQKNPLDDYSELLELRLHPDDNLTSLSVKFRTSPADLKRVNGIVNDYEIHGLKILKIPIKPHQHHLKEELEAFIEERENSGMFDVTNKPSDPLSTDASEAEDDSTHPLSSIDGDGMENIPMLSDPHTSRSHHNKRNGRDKFDKFLREKEEEIQIIRENVGGEPSDLTAAFPNSDQPYIVTQNRKCLDWNPTLPCVIGSLVILIVIIGLLTFHFTKHPGKAGL